MSWKILSTSGCDVVFATQTGKPASADPLMITGEELDPWGFVPVLKKLRLIGLLLRARSGARLAYAEMMRDPNFETPERHSGLQASDFDGLILPGGHARGMRPYLESSVLQAVVASFFELEKPVGAICHGVVLAARSSSPKTGRSVLYGRKTTALTWVQERAAWQLTRYGARFWDSTYYRTYTESADEPVGHWSVESEVKRALEHDSDFLTVPTDCADARRKTDNLHRDTDEDPRSAWVVRDRNYVSARWPGDAHTFAKTFLAVLGEHVQG